MHTTRLLLGATILLMGGIATAQDDYLMELEGTMEDVAPTAPTEAAATPAPATPGEAAEPMSPQHEDYLHEIGVEVDNMSAPAGGDEVPENARDQFDSDLQDRMPGTFVLYSRLPDGKKDRVFDEYQMSGDYLRVRRKIIELRRAN